MTTATLIHPAHVDSLEQFWNDAQDVTHSSQACPEVCSPAILQSEQTGWLCSTCIEVTVIRGPLVQGDSIDPPERGEGTGSSSAPARSDLPTDKQLSFLLKLIAEKLQPASPEKHLEGLIEAGLTKRKASQLIDSLMSAPAPAAPAGSPAVYRWTKVAGEWLVKGPAKNDPTGQTITVTKASGETAQAVIVAERGTQQGITLYQVQRAEQAERAEASTPGSRSFTATMLTLRDRIVELTRSQTKDRSIRVCVPASVLGVKDQPDAAYRIGWGWESKGADRHVGGVGSIAIHPLSQDSAVKLAEHLLEVTPEELRAYQVAYGQHFHECGRCGAPLSDKDSKARGLGPDCARKG